MKRHSKLKKAILQLLQLIAILTLFGAGILFFILKDDTLIHDPKLYTSLGIFFLATSLLLSTGFYFLSKGKRLYIQMGTKGFAVDLPVLHKILEEFFQKKEISYLSAHACKEKLEIEVSAQTEDELIPLEHELVPHLKKCLGLALPFIVILKKK